jgi:hypothetical protein
MAITMPFTPGLGFSRPKHPNGFFPFVEKIVFTDPYPDSATIPRSLHRVTLTGATAGRFLEGIWNAKTWNVEAHLAYDFTRTPEPEVGGPPEACVFDGEFTGQFNEAWWAYPAYFNNERHLEARVFFREPQDRANGGAARTYVFKPDASSEEVTNGQDTELFYGAVCPYVNFYDENDGSTGTIDGSADIREVDGGPVRGNAEASYSYAGTTFTPSGTAYEFEVDKVWYKSADEIDVILSVPFLFGPVTFDEDVVALCNIHTVDGDYIPSPFTPYAAWVGGGETAKFLTPVNISFFGVVIPAQLARCDPFELLDPTYTINSFSLSLDVTVSEYYTYPE